MANTERYETVIRLNTEQAKKEMADLTEKVRKLQIEQAKYTEGSKQWNKIQKQIDNTNKDLEKTELRTKAVGNALNNLSDAKPKELKKTISDLNKMLSSKDIERGSVMWRQLTSAIKEAQTEMEHIRDETKASTPVFQKFFNFLNDSWGGVVIIFESITRLTTSVRSSVEDFATMEEAMADVRKYTGMTDNEVRDLNEDLKKMDTRTSREELNELAGAAGRLGKSAKEDVLDFVDAGNQIKVSLGDDLGEGAIDKVGKLAMAFGEDEDKGLRGAMLATGSAINELAQNSSANAGFIVDFTARVAGFGKQIGLTQAQIMGFGAVMDENLLRDEMAATAFGNMLTKMQTDTEKFAKIAGKDVKEFTDLLNNDANAAILALADSLKATDPQDMMKMLDDMGLDGSRAVAVLATMADKIDDVRARQELATKAYEEATSVTDEYKKMNETVEAQIEKAKKEFHEMSVELGEQLLPVVKYTITSGSALIKVMSALVTLFYQWKGTIISVGLTLAALTAYRKIDVMWSKLQVFWNEKLLAGLKNIRKALVPTPWTAAFVAIAAVVGIIIDLVRHSDEAAKKQRELTAAEREHKAMAESMKTVTEEANKATAEEITKFKLLRKTLEDNTKKYDERKKALDEIKKMVPSYHGELTSENTLINNNTTALDNYVSSLMTAARAQAAFNRMVKIQDDSMSHEEELRKRKGNRQWAKNKLEDLGAPENPKYVNRGDGKWNMYDENGKFIKRVTNQQKEQIDHYVELVNWNNERISQEEEILDINRKQSEELQKIVEKSKEKKKPQNTTDYVSDADRKKQEQEQRKAEADRKKREAEELKAVREQNKQLKAETDQRLAEEAVSYSLGLTDYLSYIEKRKEIQLEGIRQRKALFEKGSAEYLKLDAQEKQLLAHGDEEQRKLTLKEYEQMHRDLLLEQEKDFNTEGSAIYQNEAAYREERFREEMDFLENKKSLTRKGSLERMQIEWEIEDRSKAHQLETQRYYEEQVEQLRENYLNMGNERLRDIALKGLDDLYRQGLIKEEEYQKARIAIQAQYASAVSPDEQTAQTGSQMLANARNKVNENAQKEDKSYSAPIVGTIQQYQATMEQLKELYANDEENHAAYLAAKQQATAEFCQQMASQFQAAYNSVNQIMSAASSLYSAQADYETAIVKKKYEKQIAAAGNNQKKVKKLQEKQQKEEAAIKTKYNRKQVKIQIAQAIAQTAMNALNAYGSMVGIPIIGPALAVVAAAAAVAAGMIQIAAIKKQAEAQEAGYYEGGYTGGKRYRKEAGVVHEGEFVANHQAVNNPNVRPMLDFIDKAQRNNTVGSLTAGDISRQLGQGGTAVVAPVVNVNNDNEDLRDSLDRSSEVSEELLTVIREKGIHVDFPMDSFHREYNHFKKLNNR